MHNARCKDHAVSGATREQLHNFTFAVIGLIFFDSLMKDLPILTACSDLYDYNLFQN